MFLPTETSTKLKLIMAIKRAGFASVDDLSRHMEMTSMGVRQHLNTLERKGIIKYTIKKHGRGRPKFLYTLTEKASEILPHSYDKLLTDILKFLRIRGGKTGVDELFKMRKEKLLREKERDLPDRKNLRARVFALAEMLNQEGYMVEVEETEKEFRLKKSHCPLSGIVREFKDPCKHELELYRGLIHKKVSLELCQHDGASSCIYIIPKV
ncbi:MAG: DeoR family transcriptional regulator [Nitrospirae bacterium]|nr:DeoR family transcriptional regulator [Nitrospirota bacterium]